MRRMPKSSTSSISKVEIPVVGGLGNQLFIYAFGLALSLAESHEVRFLQTKSGLGNNTHGIRLLDQLELSSPLVTFRDSNAFSRLSYGVGRRLRFQKRRSPVYLEESDFRNTEDLVGQLCSRAAEYRLTGYFQSPDSTRALQALGLMTSLTPKSPSSWYLQSLSGIADANRIGMHIRRGDTVKIPSHGLLSLGYYEKSLSRIKSGADFGPVLVFSDDPQAVAKELANIRSPFDFEIVCPPNDSKASESMALMSQCSTLIIGNSTFSWWAANSGSLDKRVIAPALWSPAGKLPIPPVDGRSWEEVCPEWAM
jgi:hypothetical protein